MRKEKFNIYLIIVLFTIVLGTLRCSIDPFVGGTETGDAVGILYNPNGSRAANAKVYVVSVDHNPIAEIKNRITSIDSSFTNDSGEYSFDSLPEGYYNIFGEGDSGLSYNDSFFVLNDTTNVFPDDTLESPGTLRGVVRLQPSDDSRTVIILMFGTKTWEAPTDTIGNFSLANMAAGTYHVRFLTTLSNYDPLDMQLTIKAGVDSLMPDTIRLTYSGIPVPEGLTASYDTLNGMVNLSWDSLNFSRLEGYIVFRNDTSSTIPDNISGNKALIDTFYTDTVFTNLLDTNSYVFEYRLKSQDTNAVMSGQYSIPVEVSAVSPTKVRTFFNFSSMNTVNDTATIHDTIKVISDFSNATRINDTLSWAVDHPDSIKRVVDVSSLSGSDTLECVWDIAGTKKIYNKVIDEGRSVWLDSTSIHILQDLPVANAGNDTAVGRSDTISLRGSKSTDGYGTIVKYEWDIGNTGNFVECFTGDTDIVAPDSLFKEIKFILQVMDDDNGVDLDTINVSNAFKLATNNANFPPRDFHASVVFDGKMWVIGGLIDIKFDDDVWYSTDGINWIQATDSAGFSARGYHTAVSFDNKIWIIAGGSGYPHLSDVWYSSDGINWTMATNSAAFGTRHMHASVVYDNKMWVIGGHRGGGNDTKNALNDVWYSIDGVNWTSATDSASFSKRCGHEAIVFENKIWIIAGAGNFFSDSYLNDVWYSSDGIVWSLATDSAGFSSRYAHTSIAFENKILLIGGGGYEGGQKNDIWCSIDGQTWIKFINSASFTPRCAHTTLLYLNKLWIIGGGKYQTLQKNDVWYLK